MDYPVIDEDYNGAKTWLVLSGDVDFTNQEMIDWDLTRYLFEHDLITFEYTALPA